MSLHFDAIDAGVIYLAACGPQGVTVPDLAKQSWMNECQAGRALRTLIAMGECVRFRFGSGYIYFAPEHASEGKRAHAKFRASTQTSKRERRKRFLQKRRSLKAASEAADLDPPIIKRTVAANDAAPILTTAPRWVFEVAA